MSAIDANAIEATRAIVASYNIHGGVGIDRRFNPERIARVIAELCADVVALQEVVSGSRAFDLLEYLADATGFRAIAGPAMRLAGGDFFGNAMLTRFPVLSVAHCALGIDRREPRAALAVDLDRSGAHLRVVTAHLGLRSDERCRQIAQLLGFVRTLPAMPTVLTGDINEPRKRCPALLPLHAHFGSVAAPPTFPALLPLLALDRVWVLPASSCASVHVHKSRRARIASDHLPLVVTLR